MNTATLLWGLVFGSIGIGYCIYGRKQDNKMAFLAGLGLLFYPYFVSGAWLLVLIGVGLMAIPFVIKL